MRSSFIVIHPWRPCRRIVIGVLIGDEAGEEIRRLLVGHGVLARQVRDGVHIGQLRLDTPLDGGDDAGRLVEGADGERQPSGAS